MDYIRVSTIIPAHNNELTIAQAIDSALAQDLDGHEVLVVNDGATDSTPSILAGYGDLIRTVEQSGRGGYNRSRNAGIRVARGQFVAFIDADDIWLPGHLAHSCTALDRNPDAVLAFSDMIPMDEQSGLGPPWIVGRAPTLRDLLTRGWRIYPSAVTIRRSTLEACGGFHEQLTNFSDVYLWLRARELGSFEYLDEALTIYRTIHFGLIADKYSEGFELFARVVRARYGRAGLPIIAYCADALAGSLVTKAVMQRDQGEIIPACKSLLRAIWRSPRYLYRYGLFRRLFRLTNICGLLGLTPKSRLTES
jgi:glycosyltransferase involved in cell wall biosynthesis